MYSMVREFDLGVISFEYSACLRPIGPADRFNHLGFNLAHEGPLEYSQIIEALLRKAPEPQHFLTIGKVVQAY